MKSEDLTGHSDNVEGATGINAPLRAALADVMESQGTDDVDVVDGNSYSPMSLSTFRLLREVMTHPKLFTPSRDNNIFGVKDVEGKHSIYAFTSAAGVETAFGADESLGCMPVPGQQLASLFMDAIGAGQEVNLVLDTHDKKWSTFLDHITLGSVLPLVDHTLFTHAVMAQLGSTPLENLDKMHDAGMLKDVFARFYKHQFTLFAVNDASLEEHGVKFMSTKVPGSAGDGESSVLSTLVFTNQFLAAEWLHFHGEASMLGKDPSLYRIQSVPMAGRDLLKVFYEQQTTPSGPILHPVLLLDPPAVRSEVNKEADYYQHLRTLAVRTGQTLLDNPDCAIKHGTSACNWMKLALRHFDDIEDGTVAE